MFKLLGRLASSGLTPWVLPPPGKARRAWAAAGSPGGPGVFQLPAPHCLTSRRMITEREVRPNHPETRRVDPESGSTLRTRIGVFSQTAGSTPAGSTCEFWVNAVGFTFQPRAVERLERRAVLSQSWFSRRSKA